MRSAATLFLILLLNSATMFVRSFTTTRTGIGAVAAMRRRGANDIANARLPGLLSLSLSSSSIVDTCRTKIATALETDDVIVTGAHDDPNGSHISIYVTSSLFEGKRPVQRQQLVYKALWEGENVIVIFVYELRKESFNREGACN